EEIFVERTDEDQWTYDVVNIEGLNLKIPSDIQADVCDASDDELMSFQGDSDNDNSKKKINARRDLEDPKFEFTLNMIFSSSKEFKWTVEVRAVMKKRTSSLRKIKIGRWTLHDQNNSHDHSCGKQREDRTIVSKILAKKYADEFKINPSWGVKEFEAH
ncbi:hypothetical protein H5410_005244, partial [Solanum commersonii]